MINKPNKARKLNNVGGIGPFELSLHAYVRGEKFGDSNLAEVMSRYILSETDTFIHVKPFSALAVPENYYVGDSIDIDFPVGAIPQMYWFDTSRNRVYCPHRVKGIVGWARASHVHRFVIDAEGTRLPIGIIFSLSENWASAIDLKEVGGRALERALQDMKGTTVSVGRARSGFRDDIDTHLPPARKVVDYDKFIASLPDPDET